MSTNKCRWRDKKGKPLRRVQVTYYLTEEQNRHAEEGAKLYGVTFQEWLQMAFSDGLDVRRTGDLDSMEATQHAEDRDD